MRSVPLLLALALASIAPALSAAAPCSDSHAQLLGFNNLFSVPAAAFDSTYTVQGYGPQSEVGFDLPAGTLKVWRVTGGVDWIRTIATDDYDLEGVTPGTVVALTAALDVNGSVTSPGCGGSGCGGYFQASITQGASSTQQQVTFANPFAGGVASLVQTLTLPITITAGTPTTVAFELAVFVPAGGNAGGSGTGVLHFAGLPVGARVISCQGYGALATPSRRSTWGRLKTLYR